MTRPRPRWSEPTIDARTAVQVGPAVVGVAVLGVERERVAVRGRARGRGSPACCPRRSSPCRGTRSGRCRRGRQSSLPSLVVGHEEGHAAVLVVRRALVARDAQRGRAGALVADDLPAADLRADPPPPPPGAGGRAARPPDRGVPPVRPGVPPPGGRRRRRRPGGIAPPGPSGGGSAKYASGEAAPVGEAPSVTHLVLTTSA